MTFQELYKINTEHYVRELRWSPIQPSTLAVGLFDGRLIVHNQEETTQIAHKVSSERILCVEWNPQIEGKIAIGSFDSGVYLVTIEGKKCESEKLVHH